MHLPPSFIRHKEQLEQELFSIWTPHPAQAAIISFFLSLWQTGLFLKAGRKFGKALCLDTPILTSKGFKRNGDIRPGDIVFDEMGNQQRVLFAHNIIRNAESYRVHFCDGSYIDACKDHRWLTWTKLNRKQHRRGRTVYPTIKNTKEIMNTLMHGKEYNHSIPYTKPPKFKYKKLPINPYLLGLWLGDGSTHKAQITSADNEILEAFINEGFPLSYYSKYDYGIKGKFKTLLKKNNLLKNKHIPEKYFFSSINQRRELLNGLMDTDGYVNKEGNCCEYVSKLKCLAEGVYYLSSSLGMKPCLKHKYVKINGKKRLYYLVRFRPIGKIFKLKRKQSRVTSPNKKTLHRTIVKVEKIKNKPMRCLTVSGDSKLYLAGNNLIPTHNTEPAIALLYMFAMLFENAECYYIADEKEHGADIIWDNGRLPRFFTTTKQNRGETDYDFRKRRDLGARISDKWGIEANNSEKMLKFNNTKSFVKIEGSKNFSIANGLSPTFAVYDEFKDHDPRFDEAMRPNLNAMKGRILVMGTPPPAEDGDEATSEHNYFKTAREFKSRKGYAYIHRYCYENYHVYPGGKNDETLIEEEKAYRAKGEYHIFAREYLGLLVPDQGRSIFPMLNKNKHRKSYQEMVDLIRKNYKKWDFYISYDPAASSTFAVLLVAIHKYKKVVLLVDEIYEQQKLETRAKEIYKRARDLRDAIYPYREEWIQIYDNAESWFQTEIALEFQDGISPCTKNVNNKEAILSVIKDCLLYGKMYISDRCPKTWDEMRNYATDIKTGKIPKKNDHNIDNLRYILNQAAYNSCERVMIDWDELSGHRFSTPERDVNRNKFDDNDLESSMRGNSDYEYVDLD